MIKIHTLQHVEYETPGSIEAWAKNNEFEMSFTRFYVSAELPELNSFDWLLIMGGPMSVHDEDKFPWLKREKEFIKSAIENDKVVIGICLGSQLIAQQLGAEVYPNEYKEIGWYRIQTTIHASDDDLFSPLPRAFQAFHWHGDTFTLPDDALHLAETDACKNQLFIWKEKVIGIQFHPEITQPLLKNMIDNGKSELKNEKYIQPADYILEQTELIAQSNDLMESILNNMKNKFT
jgi:GMP synthase (glutamine-hydrolysing)